jgi:DNA-binding NarL/FixJ family response regulator
LSGARRIQVILVADDRASGHARRARRMRRGEITIETSLGGAGFPDAPPVVAKPTLLSGREQEVLGMMAQGLRDKQIADLLYIADRTVKFHAQSIYRKLNVANRTEAVSVALRRGFIVLDASVPSASDAA